MTRIDEKEKEIPEEKVQDTTEVPKGFGELKDVEPNIWKAEKDGDCISGILVNIEPRVGDLSAKYFLDDGSAIKMVWGCRVLDDRMALAHIGDYVRITYKGVTETKSKRKLHLYKVEVAERSKK